MHRDYYQTLNLRPSAEENEIKRAFRQLAKQYHPDSAGYHGGDRVRFQEISEAYQALIHKKVQNAVPPKNADKPKPKTDNNAQADDWRFEGIFHQGLDIVYILGVGLGAARYGLEIDLPVKQEIACPKCLGAGHTYSFEQSDEGVRVKCPRYLGGKVEEHNSMLKLDIVPLDLKRGEKRFAGKGHYDPALGRRGEIVVRFEALKETYGSDAKFFNA